MKIAPFGALVQAPGLEGPGHEGGPGPTWRGQCTC